MQKIDLEKKPWPTHMFSVINEPVEIHTDPRILILIPSKDRNDLLFQCIDSILTHTSKKLTNIEIQIVDTGSTQANLDAQTQYVAETDSHIILGLVKHDKYNFAWNNNTAFDQVGGAKRFDYVVFCNNDIKFLNDVLSHMVWTYENKEKVGTVGARLHFGDGTLQHIGAFCKFVNNSASPGHYGFNKATTGSILDGCQAVPANTCALMMVKADIFSKLKFNEDYLECFEDVQLNLSVSIGGLINYCNLSAVAFHYESQSRNEDKEKESRQQADLHKLSKFVESNKSSKFIRDVVCS
jgi:GT2 family glycosyltransferase